MSGTHRVSRVYYFEVILWYNVWYTFPWIIVSYFCFIAFRSISTVQVWLCSVFPWFPVVLFRLFLDDYETILFALIITGITSVMIFHRNCYSTLRPLNFKLCLSSLLITFISPKHKGLLNHCTFVFYSHGLQIPVYC